MPRAWPSTSGLRRCRVWSFRLCGDAHLSNFGLFASPERRLLFDINDFDESLPGPWEWDVKRLAASLDVAGRENGFTDKERRKCVVKTVRRYRDAMAQFAAMPALDVWYARADVEEVVELLRTKISRSRRKSLDKAVAKARSSDRLKAFAKLTEIQDGQVRIKSDPPLLVPMGDLLPDADREGSRTRSWSCCPTTAAPCRATGECCSTSSSSSTWHARSWVWAASACAAGSSSCVAGMMATRSSSRSRRRGRPSSRAPSRRP